MRVLFLNYEYPPLGGGAGNATFYLLREFAKIPGLEIDLVTSSIDNQCHWEKVGEKINIHRIPIGKNKKNLHYQSQKDILTYAWKSYWFSRKLAKQKKYNLTHSFFTVPCGFLSLLFKYQYNLPYIVSLRGADVPGYSERFSFVYKLLKPLIKTIWKNAAAVAANSQGLKDLALKSKPDQKIEVIYNGVDTDQFRPADNLEAKFLFQIVCVSRLTKRKGINYLLEAFGILLKNHPDISLNIVGEGDAKKELMEQAGNSGISEKVNFAGLIKHDSLPEVYQSADIFALPSLNEGMSNTMLEALASGLPIAATNTGGTRELVNEGINGFIIKMKNSEDIALKLEKLITNPELRKKMSAASRKKAEEMSWEKAAGKYFESYKEIEKKK